MIRSFLKRVFSTSNETASTAEATAVEEQNGAIDGSSTSKTVEIQLSWIEMRNIRELEEVVKACYIETEENREQPVRFRLRLNHSLQASDDSNTEGLRAFLDFCEREILDFTFLMDKKDQETIKIYKTSLLPNSVEELNIFLRDRCMMIYETSDSLGLDYRKEIEDFFDALSIPLGESFFTDFERFTEEVLYSNQEEVHQSEEELPVSTTKIEVSREEVENENILQFDKYMEQVLQNPEQAKRYKGTLLFSFYGFGRHEDLLRMMNRKEIKDWASILVEKHPYIFYFLNDLEYPMTKFLTSLVVSTEIEDHAVFYNEEELSDFRSYISESLSKLATWIGEDEIKLLEEFESHFQEE